MMHYTKHRFSCSSLLLVLAVLLSLPAQATVLTVSSQSNYPAQYTSLIDAIAAASSGDTLLIAGAPTNYNYSGIGSTININKQLTLIGAGYDPEGMNSDPSSVHSITLQSGSDGTKIIGMRFRDQGIYPGVLNLDASVSNILVERCYFDGSLICDGNNAGLIFRNCVFNDITFNSQIEFGLGSQNVLFHNNIVMNANIFRDSDQNTVMIINNSFYHDAAIGNRFFNVSNAIIQNNIFHTWNPGGCDNCVFNNNMAFNSANDALPYGTNTGSGNITADPNYVNAAVTDPGLMNDGVDFSLSPGSPAIGASTGGNDLGCTGLDGGAPFTFGYTGQAPIPLVLTATVRNPVVGVGTDIEIDITAVSKP